MYYFIIVGLFLFSQICILYLLIKENYEFKFLFSFVTLLLIVMPLIIKIMELRFLAPFFIGVILFLVGILTSKKSYMYLGSIYSLFVVIFTSYLIYILPEA